MKNRFTLIELMTVVAVLAVLTALALPVFHINQLRAKRAEINVNLPSLLDAAIAYHAALDSYGTSSGAFHPSAMNKLLQPWEPGAPAAFDDLAWAPDGDVRAGYVFQTDNSTYVRAIAQSDVDDDAKNYYRRDALDPGTEVRIAPELETCTGGGSVLLCF